MAERTLTRRELNRALLARQLLLERVRLPIPRALERIGGIQDQYARLASSAGAGEALVSRAAADASMLDASGLESRTLTLRGKDEMIDALVLAA